VPVDERKHDQHLECLRAGASMTDRLALLDGSRKQYRPTIFGMKRRAPVGLVLLAQETVNRIGDRAAEVIAQVKLAEPRQLSKRVCVARLRAPR